mgnify:CR=1 FL=1
MSNSVAELVANCFDVSGVGGENPEKWKAVTAVSALEAKLEAMEREVLRYQEKADAIHKYLGAKEDSALLAVITELSLDAQRRAAAQQEKEDE